MYASAYVASTCTLLTFIVRMYKYVQYIYIYVQLYIYKIVFYLLYLLNVVIKCSHKSDTPISASLNVASMDLSFLLCSSGMCVQYTYNNIAM